MGGKNSSMYVVTPLLVYLLSSGKYPFTYISPFRILLFPFSQLFRLEHEHLYNSFNYRKVSFVPLHFSTEIKEKEELDPKQGLRILTEVLVMAVLVIIATVLSIILARVSNNYDDDLPQDHL